MCNRGGDVVVIVLSEFIFGGSLDTCRVASQSSLSAWKAVARQDPEERTRVNYLQLWADTHADQFR